MGSKLISDALQSRILSVFEQIAEHPANTWQLRLIQRFATGDLPGALDIPTGLGKTAVIPIWAAARLSGAPIPRRLVYVVDRRVVVDQATELAERVAKQIDADPQMATQMRSVDERGIAISTLRGQYADNRQWLLDPTASAIIVGTVDMIGSRLMFEGYGVSRGTRPMHAALLSRDSLLVIDESHLVPAFARLSAWVSERNQCEAFTKVAPPLKIMTMSATGVSHDNVFTLSNEDRKTPWIAERLQAPKRARLIDIEAKSLVTELTARARSLSADGSRVVVFVNSFKDATAVLKKLSTGWTNDVGEKCQAPELARLTGQTRVAERATLANDSVYQRFTRYTLDEKSNQPPSVLIATSAGEVGADFSGDHLVCDLVAWERMVQRFGRVNRAGASPDTVVDILIDPTKWAEDKERLSELKKPFENPLWQKDDDERIDLSPGSLLNMGEDRKFQQDAKAATTATPWFAPLELATLDAWSMTSVKTHHARPAVEPWLRGWDDESQEPNATLVWRRWLPTRNYENDYVRDAPVHLLESLETRRSAAQEWLAKRVGHVNKSVDKAATSKDEILNEWMETLRQSGDTQVVALAISGSGEATTLTWTQLKDKVASANKKRRPPEPYATLIIDCRLGGLDSRGVLDDTCGEQVLAWDSYSENHKANADADAGQYQRWQDLFKPIERRLRSGAMDIPPEPGYVRLRYREVESSDIDSDTPSGRWIERRVQAEADFRGSDEQKLDDHQTQVRSIVTEFARRLSLPEHLTDILILAAAHHDDGKNCPHWQKAMRVPDAKRPLAKTKGSKPPLDLAGYRHEFGSLQTLGNYMTNFDDDQRELIRHLVASHHGYARPQLNTFDPNQPPALRVGTEHESENIQAAAIARRFIQLQTRYGHYGLAWLESILRCADWMASAAPQSSEEPS